MYVVVICREREIGLRETMYYTVLKFWNMVVLNVVKNNILYREDCNM